jgi:hypothetical protein
MCLKLILKRVFIQARVYHGYIENTRLKLNLNGYLMGICLVILHHYIDMFQYQNQGNA